MKKILFFLLVFVLKTQAQTVLFHENFDGPSGPDSVTTYNVNILVNAQWNDTNAYSVSGTKSYHASTSVFDTVFFQTISFSTLGQSYTVLEFDHIAKVLFLHSCVVELSVDSGFSWTLLDSNYYQGASPSFDNLAYFNEIAYPAPNVIPYWGGITTSSNNVTPTNAWWAHETFDLSPIASLIQPNGDTGYANVMVRFGLQHRLSFPLTTHGWFVDNVKVTGAPCETVAPVLDAFHPDSQFPEGHLYDSISTVKIRATDNIGLDSARVFYRINGGSWQSQDMLQSLVGTCTNANTYTRQLLNVQVGDTIEYYVKVYDCSCPNSSTYPADADQGNYISFWRQPRPPVKCGSGLLTAPHMVWELPYVETFDNPNHWTPGFGPGLSGTSHRGSFPTGNPPGGLNWNVAPTDVTAGYAWSIRNTGTGTNGTGPSFDHTSGNGNYLYTEADQGNNNDISQLITPCIDLSDTASIPGCLILEFWVHMNGNGIGLLRVDVDTGLVNQEWKNNIWKQTGAFTQNPNQWKLVQIPLSEYKGQIVKFRFLARRGTNTKGDIAIDDIRIYESSTADMVLSDIVLPQENRCSYSWQEDIQVEVRNLGCYQVDSVPIRIDFLDSISGFPMTQWDTLQYLGAGKDTIWTLSPTIDMLFNSVYKLDITLMYDSDSDTSNNTLNRRYEGKPVLSSFPLYESFDHIPWNSGNGTFTNPGSYDSSIFTIYPDPFTPYYSWHVGSQGTPSFQTGPVNSRSGKGNYLYTEGDYVSANNQLAELGIERCLDFTGMTSPILDYWYHMYSEWDTLDIVVQAKLFGQTWDVVDVQDDMQSSETDPWKLNRVDLSAYAGDQIQLRVLGRRNISSDFTDIAIDDIAIYDSDTTDVGITALGPKDFIGLPAQQSDLPSMRVFNFGNTTISNVPVALEITALCGPQSGITLTYRDTVSSNIAPGTWTQLVMDSLPDYPSGDFTMKAYTELTNDVYAFNDTVYQHNVGRSNIDIRNGYFQNFDNCDSGTDEGYVSLGGFGVFHVGSPSGSPISSPPSGLNAMITGDFQEFYQDDQEILLLPKFIGFDSIRGAELRFSHSFDLHFSDAAIVEYYDLVDAEWKTLGDYKAVPVGCGDIYNESFVNQLGGEPGWVGSQNWTTHCVPLNEFNNFTGAASIRFRLASSYVHLRSEWAIDNIEVYIPPQLDVATESLTPVSIPTTNSGGVDVDAQIRNVAYQDVSNLMLYYQLNSGAIDSMSVNWSNALSRNKARIITINVNANMNQGIQNLCVWTKNPNGKQDENTSNDTLCLDFNVLEAKSLPYCNDFESGSEFYAGGTILSSTDTLWEHGIPNNVPIVTANSGSKVWMTGLNGDYKSLQEDNLYTDPISIVQGDCYQLSFYHQYEVDNLFDGGVVEYSFDYGLTWEVLGNYGDSGWYNQPYIYALGLVYPGFSGSSNGWQKVEWLGDFDQNGEVIIRFRFASNQNYENAGWAIDDFCFEFIPGNCNISVEENGLNGFTYYPNPAHDYANVSLNAPSNDVQIQVVNMEGKMLLDQYVPFGEMSTRLDISHLDPGIYILQVMEDGVIKSVEKLVVQ